MNDGFVYCAMNESNELFKIGYSKDVYKRIAQLNTGSLIKLDLVMFIPATRAIESAFHYRLRRYKFDTHSAREYFVMTPETIRLINYHMEYGFSDSYVRRVKWRSNYKSERYKEKLKARNPRKQPVTAPVDWIIEAGKVFAANEIALREFNRISPNILPSYPSVLQSIAEQSTRRIITNAQAQYAAGIVRAYINACDNSASYYSGGFLELLPDVLCRVCNRKKCTCGLNLTRRKLSAALFDVYGDGYSIRHGYVKPSKRAQDFAGHLKLIFKNANISEYYSVNMSDAWRVA